MAVSENNGQELMFIVEKVTLTDVSDRNLVSVPQNFTEEKMSETSILIAYLLLTERKCLQRYNTQACKL